MNVENFFFFSISFITLVYGIKVAVEMFLDRKKVKDTKGRIIDFEFVLPEAMKHRNAKLVTFEYYINGRRYTSENNLKMPLSSNIGDYKDIKYYIDNPNILYTKTEMHFYLSIITSLLCFLLGLIRY